MNSIYKAGDFIIIKSDDVEKQFEIIECGSNFVRILDDFSQVESKRKITELDELVVAGIAKIMPKNLVERELHKSNALDFASYPEHNKLIARERFIFVCAIIDADLPSNSEVRITPIVSEVFKEHSFETIDKQPSTRNVQRWIKSYRIANNSIRALIPLTSSKGNRRPKVKEEIEHYMAAAISHFKQREKPIISSSYDHLKTLIEYDNILISDKTKKRRVPSLTAFIKRLEKEAPKPLMIAREGKRAANIAFKETKNTQDISLILQRVEADHTQLDLFIVDKKSSLVLGRPYVTAILDYKSKSVLGFYIGFESPSYLSIARALRHAILPKSYLKDLYPEVVNDWPCYGIPRVLVVDRGKDFESIALVDACLDLNIRIHRNPGRHPWYKGTVERYFRSLNDDLLSDKRGKVFPNIVDSNAYNSEKNAVITMDLFLQIFHKWVVDIYQKDLVSKGTIIPNESWREDIGRVPRRVMDREALDLVLAETSNRVNTKDGIVFEHIQYDNAELAKLRALHGFDKVDFKYDREDLGSIQVLNSHDQFYFKVPAVNQKYANGLSLHQHRVVKTFHRKYLEGKVDQEALAAAKVQITEMIKEHFEANKSKKIGATHKAARYLGIGQQSDQTTRSSITEELERQREEYAGIPKPSPLPSKSSKTSSKSISEYDGTDNTLPKKLDFD